MVSAAKIDRLTARITEYRLWRHIRRHHERRKLEDYVALEIKGLKAKAIKAAGHLDRLNLAYDKFNEAAPQHAADVEGLTPQIEGLAEDLQFATQVLGNSAGAGAESGGGVGAFKPSPAVLPPNLPNPPPEPPLAIPAANQTASDFIASQQKPSRDVADQLPVPSSSHYSGS